jgi:hypothetical protein
LVLLWSALERARRDAGTLMSNERGCGRDADSNTRDVTSGAAIARGQFARSIKLLGGSCNVALRAAAAALRVGCDFGEGARWHRRELHDMPVAPVWSIRNDATSFLGHHISATFELRAGGVKAEARRVERSESLDDVEHSSTLIM